MATFQTLTPAQVDAKSPINQLLMYGNTGTDTGGVKFNFDALDTRLTAVEGGGSGGGGGAEDSGAIGEIILGGKTDEAIYWKRRFHPLQHMLNADSKNPSGFDPEGKSLKNELLHFIQSNDTGITYSAVSDMYLGGAVRLAKASKISFKVKQGINFFSIGISTGSGTSDNVEVFIDGATPTSLGLVDENGTASANSFSGSTATVYRQLATFFYGLDGEEHIVTIVNNDSGTDVLNIEFIEVGYRSENPTIDETVHINSGRAIVRGSEVIFADGNATFTKTELNGHTAAIVCDNTGTLSALDGESPAMTQAKPEETVAFSSPVTQLKVKNNFYFPDNGICLLSTPYGNHHLFSYSGKTDAAIQSHSLDDLLWSSQPTEDYTPCDNFTGGVGTATGDLNINYWGTAPIEITTSNNKLDFKVTIAGATTTHVATIPSGRYSADLVPLENAVRKAMQTAKAISGEYHLKYSAAHQLWTIYIDDEEIENFECVFSTGANVANSIHTTLGFPSTDFTGAKSYLGTTEVQHLCCRALERDSVYMHSEDPRIKYSSADSALTATASVDVIGRLNLGEVRRLTGTANLMQVFPDQDCCGLELNFVKTTDGSMITIQIDDGPCTYLTQFDTTIVETSVRGIIQTGFISFPRGSRKITLRAETSGQFSLAGSTKQIYFAGARQYFTKPAYEKLTVAQSVIKTFDISPISLYATIYGHNGGTLYSPAAQDDNINTITEVGSWSGAAASARFNNGVRQTVTSGDYVDVDFTLQGDGGGIGMKLLIATSQRRKIGLYISTVAIVEGTDKISNTHCVWGSSYYDQDAVGILGLSAGTYKARFKVEDSGSGPDLYNHGFIVYDTVAPQENANTVTDINNTGQGVAYPINVIREVIQQDSAERVPSWLDRSGYKEGRVSKVNYSLNSPAFENYDDSSALITQADSYFGNQTSENVSGTIISISGFMKSISLRDGCFSTYSTTAQAFIDGVQTLNNHSYRNQVKGGSAPSATRNSKTQLIQKLFNLSSTHNAGLVFNISDTRGLKNDTVVILDDGTNKEKAVIASFVVGVSYTIKKALTTVVAANVVAIEFQGFHSYKIESNDAVQVKNNAFEYEPLKVSPSKAIQRRATDLEYEKVSVTHDYVAGDDLYYPVHSDGVVGNWTTSTIERIKGDGLLYDFPQDLKNVTGTGKVKISSERLVPVLKEQERF